MTYKVWYAMKDNQPIRKSIWNNIYVLLKKLDILEVLKWMVYLKHSFVLKLLLFLKFVNALLWKLECYSSKELEIIWIIIECGMTQKQNHISTTI